MQDLPPLLGEALLRVAGAGRVVAAEALREADRAVSRAAARAAAARADLAALRSIASRASRAPCFWVARDALSSDFSRAVAARVLAACAIWSSVLLSSSARWSARLFSFAGSRAGRVRSRLMELAARSNAGGTVISGAVALCGLVASWAVVTAACTCSALLVRTM